MRRLSISPSSPVVPLPVFLTTLVALGSFWPSSPTLASDVLDPPTPLLAEMEIVDFDGFHRPSGVTTLASGNVAVADEVTGRVEIFSSKGAHLWGFGGRGSEPGLFLGPSDLALSSEGDLLVADPGNMRVQRVNEFGDLVATHPTPWAIQRILPDENNGFLAARSFVSGAALVERFDANGAQIEEYGTRLSPSDFGLRSDGPVLDASLNNFSWGLPGDDGLMPIAFVSLGLVQVIDADGGTASRFALPLRATKEAHRVWHDARSSEFAAGGRSDPCEDSRPENLARDLEALSYDGKPHFMTVITGVGRVGDACLVVADGIAHVTSLEGEIRAEYALLSRYGDLAYSHRLSADGNAPGVFYSVDNAHRLAVYRYRIPE